MLNRRRLFYPFIVLLGLSLACSLTDGDGDAAIIDEPPVEATEVPVTEPPLAVTEEPAGIPVTACEEIPDEAAVRFLYGIEIATVTAEQETTGVACRFQTIDVAGTAGDLGRSAAFVRVKLWNSLEACQAVSDPSEASEPAPPAPWNYLRVVTIPDKPDLILSVTAYDGEHCVTAAAADISSQPLAHWLDFLGAIAGSL